MNINKFYLYKLNYENEYFYIGVTNNINRRLSEHGKEKYGHIFLYYEILFESFLENEIYQKEKQVVNKDTVLNEKCLNKSAGGKHPHLFGLRTPHTEKTKLNISKNRKGKCVGRIVSDEEKQKRKETLIKNYGVDNYFKTEEMREKVSLRMKENNPCKGKPGTMLGKQLSKDAITKISYKIKTPDGIFESSVKAAKFYNICQQTVINRCKSNKFSEWEIISKGTKYKE